MTDGEQTSLDEIYEIRKTSENLAELDMSREDYRIILAKADKMRSEFEKMGPKPNNTQVKAHVNCSGLEFPSLKEGMVYIEFNRGSVTIRAVRAVSKERVSLVPLGCTVGGRHQSSSPGESEWNKKIWRRQLIKSPLAAVPSSNKEQQELPLPTSSKVEDLLLALLEEQRKTNQLLQAALPKKVSGPKPKTRGAMGHLTKR